MTLAITVVYADLAVETMVKLALPDTATVAEAVAASGLIEQLGLDRSAIGFAIFGLRADPAIALHDGDRIELTRPLHIDAKAARHARAAKRRRDL